MKKKTEIGLLIAGTAAVAFAAARVQRYYWTQFLPNRLFKQVKYQIADPDKITGGWIRMVPDAGWQNERVVSSYHGGVTTKTANFTFEVAANGEILHIERTD